MIGFKAARTAAVAAAAIGGLLLAGCSAGAPDSGSGSSASKAQTLRLAVGSPPADFSIGNLGGEATLPLSVYDTILHRDVDGGLSGGIAEKWEYSDDLTTLTLHIRKGMSFTDKSAIDAAAVVASLEVARKGASTAGNLASVKSVEARDDLTVVVTLNKPDASLIPTLSSMVGAVGDPDVLTAESSKLQPVGSGPYTLSKDSVAGSKYILERNEDYWNSKEYPFDRVEVQVISDTTAVQNALKAGQLDFAYIPKDALAQFPESKFNTGMSKANAFSGLFLVDREGKLIPALKDKRVRQAINLVFDRERMVEKLSAGLGIPTAQVTFPDGPSYSKDLNEVYSYDVERAKKLMAEAGYADGFAVTMPSTPLSTAYESIITQSLGEIGIKVTWETVPLQDFYTKVLGGSYGMYFIFNGYSGSDAQDINAALSGVFNPFQSTSPELQDLIAAANASKDEGAFAKVNKFLVDEAWFAPFAAAQAQWAVPKSIDYTPPVVFGSLLSFKPAN